MRMRKIVDVWTEIFLYAIWVFFVWFLVKSNAHLVSVGSSRHIQRMFTSMRSCASAPFFSFRFFFVIPIFIYIDSSSFVPNKIFSMFVSTKVRRDIVLWLFLSLNWNDKQQQTNGVNDEVERRKKKLWHIPHFLRV